MSHTEFDESGVPILPELMHTFARKNNLTIVYIINIESIGGESESSSLALTPDVPRVGDLILDQSRVYWRVHEVIFKTSLAPLDDGTSRIRLVPTVTAVREQPQQAPGRP